VGKLRIVEHKVAITTVDGRTVIATARLYLPRPANKPKPIKLMPEEIEASGWAANG
jgi:hypothetical protein